jgi:hypothetical protein
MADAAAPSSSRPDNSEDQVKEALQTASKFPLRWWIINSIVFAYVGSTHLQGRIAQG